MNDTSVRVEKIINGGYGLARMNNGRVVLLRHVLPGERVTYIVDERRKNTYFGSLEHVLEQHKDRISAPCPYYGSCGGCDLQHCSYEGQLDIKNGVIADLFQRSDIPLSPIIASPRQFGYRQRIRLQVQSGKVGYFQHKSSDFVPITSCLIAHPAINISLQATLPNRSFQQLCQQSRTVEFHLDPENNAVTLILNYLRKPRPGDRKAALTLTGERDGPERVFFKGESFSIEGPIGQGQGNTAAAKHFTVHIEDSVAVFTHRLIWEVGGFCQVNTEQNQQIIDYVLCNCRPLSDQTVLDLFCGMGNFSIPLANSAKSLLGAEGQGSAVRSAKLNSRATGQSNTRFIKGPIHNICNELYKEKRTFDITVVDPPRQGIPGLAGPIATLTRASIIYVSCDPATLARDIDSFKEHNVHVRLLQPFDMFPQTHHIETVAILEKD